MTLILKKKLKPISYTWREKMEHQSWCIKNDIIIYFQPVEWPYGKIIIVEKGVSKQGEHKYKARQKDLRPKDEKWWVIVEKLYTNKYEKYNGKTRSS